MDTQPSPPASIEVVKELRGYFATDQQFNWFLLFELKRSIDKLTEQVTKISKRMNI